MSDPSSPSPDCHPSCPPEFHARAVGGIHFFLNSVSDLISGFVDPSKGSIVIREVVDAANGATFHAVCLDSPTSTPDAAEGSLLFLIPLDEEAHKRIKPVYNTSTQGFLGHEIPRDVLADTLKKVIRDATTKP